MEYLPVILLLLFPFVLLLDFGGKFIKGLPYVLLCYLAIGIAFFFFDVVPLWTLPLLVLSLFLLLFITHKKVKDSH